MDYIISKIKSLVQSGQKRDILLLSIALDAVFTFSVSICSLVVSNTANAGFNVVFTSILNIGYVAGSYFIVTKSKTPLAIGFLIGVTANMSALNFMTAIYWGQLSHYDSSNQSADRAVCVFSVFIFLLQAFVCAATVLWKNELIGDDSSQYDSLNSGPASAGGTYENVIGPSFLDPTIQTSADL